MIVTDVRCELLSGSMDGDPEEYFEDRLWRPSDVYADVEGGDPTAPREAASSHPYVEDGSLKVKQIFVIVETDEGVTGIAGPIDHLWAYAVLEMASLVVGRDPFATEKVLDVLYGHMADATEGVRAKAVSAIDVALWDIRGKALDVPVHRILGGPTRTELPTYASMLRFAAEPEAAGRYAREFRDRGFPAQKWFFRYGVGDGEDGKRANLATVAALRDAVGEDYDLMFDCWRKWGHAYTNDLIPDLDEYDPRWLEQPVDDDHVDASAAITEAAPFPIAGGEHAVTRWGAKALLDARAVDVFTPDLYWTGGFTEMGHIASVASTYNAELVLHGYSLPANVQFTAATPPSLVPYVEYLVKWNESTQFFFDRPVLPEDGTITVPDRPGVGVGIDERKVEDRTEVTFP